MCRLLQKQLILVATDYREGAREYLPNLLKRKKTKVPWITQEGPSVQFEETIHISDSP
jgi:hypothetical protein